MGDSSSSGWEIPSACFVGENASIALSGPRDNAVADEYRVPVDGRLIVNRTRDGGQTFEQLSNGLPQQHCYDLIYRHCLDIDGSGDRLAMGSTTGSLWVSENGGDDWHCISTHLPPIHCIRFAP